MIKLNICYLTIILLALISLKIISASQPVYRLDSLQIDISDSVRSLGATELGQRQGVRAADNYHLALKVENNAWYFANNSLNKKIEVQTDTTPSLFIKRILLQNNDIIQIGSQQLLVNSVTKKSISLIDTKTGKSADWANGLLRIKNQEMYPADWWTVFKRQQLWKLRNTSGEQFLFSLGGTINLYNQWVLEGVPSRGAWIVWSDNSFYLAPGTEQRTFTLSSGNQESSQSFQDTWLPLSGPKGTVSRLIVGSTYYQVQQAGERLTLRPSLKIDVFGLSEPKPQLVEGLHPIYTELTWIGAGKSFLEWMKEEQTRWMQLLGAGTLLAILTWHITARYNIQVHTSVYLSCIQLPLLILLNSAGMTIDLRWPLIMLGFIWISTTWILYTNKRLKKTAGWLWLCAILLAGNGVLFHLQLFAGSKNTVWAIYAWKQCFYTALGGWAIGCIGNIPRQLSHAFFSLFGGENRFERGIVTIKALLYFGALFLLLLMSVKGEEQGLGSFQPTEAMKLVIVALAAFTTIDIAELHFTAYKHEPCNLLARVGQMGSVAILFAVMLLATAFSLLWIADISPVIIIFSFLIGWLWMVSSLPQFDPRLNNTRVAFLVRAGLILFITLTLALFLNVYQAPENWTLLPQHERFLAWSSPENYPISASQVNSAMHLAGQGGWLGAEGSWFGNNETGNSLPAVQDDFSLAFYLYKSGALSGMLLSLTQLAYLCLLMRTGLKLISMKGDYISRQSGVTFGFILVGLVFMHGIQWTISWGNTLGLLPVMGQPMTWLSSGNSHLLFVGFACLLTGLFGSWITDSVEHSSSPVFS